MPHSSQKNVQAHDILYRASQDIPYTLRARNARRREQDALENDGRTRTTGTVCSGGDTAGEDVVALCQEFGISRPVGSSG